jgi:hypothetical protein
MSGPPDQLNLEPNRIDKIASYRHLISTVRQADRGKQLTQGPEQLPIDGADSSHLQRFLQGFRQPGQRPLLRLGDGGTASSTVWGASAPGSS